MIPKGYTMKELCSLRDMYDGIIAVGSPDKAYMADCQAKVDEIKYWLDNFELYQKP